MHNFIKADLYKNRKTKTIYILFLIAACTAIGIALVMKGMASGDYGAEMGVNISLATDTMLVALFGGMIVGGLVSDDFESKSIHNEILAGKGRLAIVIAKLFSFAILFAIVILPYVLVTIIGSSIDVEFAKLGGVPSQFFDMLADASVSDNLVKCIVLSILCMYIYIVRLSICIPVAFKVRKKIPVMVIGFVTAFVFDIVLSLVKDVPVISDIIKALPYYQMTRLTMDASAGTIVQVFIFGTIYLAVMVGITHLIFRKGEIK